MANISRLVRQQTIDEYLEGTSRDKIVPAQFLEWLRPQHNHSAWPYFFSATQEERDNYYFTARFSEFVSGLRITVRPTEFVQRSTGSLKVVGSTFGAGLTEPLQAPVFFSPVTERARGGGYIPFDPENSAHRESWAEEAARRLDEWIARYELAIVDAGLTLDGVRAMRDQIAAFADKTKRIAA